MRREKLFKIVIVMLVVIVLICSNITVVNAATEAKSSNNIVTDVIGVLRILIVLSVFFAGGVCLVRGDRDESNHEGKPEGNHKKK